MQNMVANILKESLACEYLYSFVGTAILCLPYLHYACSTAQNYTWMVKVFFLCQAALERERIFFFLWEDCRGAPSWKKKKEGKHFKYMAVHLPQPRKKMSNPKSSHMLILKETWRYGMFALFYNQPKAVWKVASCSTRILWFLVRSAYITNGNYGAMDPFTGWKKKKKKTRSSLPKITRVLSAQ